ncbi:MAG: accessory factor UbiK family protein [Rhodocyclaceae bacterium]|nr:accessory factor UbiK family protein [Rhodocyclaceae bacterium]
MLKPDTIDDFSARISKLAAASPAADLEKNLRALLGGLFSRLDLVTREEYEVQVALLEKARERLAALEARVAEFERR